MLLANFGAVRSNKAAAADYDTPIFGFSCWWSYGDITLFAWEKQVLPRFEWGAGRIGTGSYDLANAEADKPVPCLHDQLDHEVEVWHPNIKAG